MQVKKNSILSAQNFPRWKGITMYHQYSIVIPSTPPVFVVLQKPCKITQVFAGTLTFVLLGKHIVWRQNSDFDLHRVVRLRRRALSAKLLPVSRQTSANATSSRQTSANATSSCQTSVRQISASATSVVSTRFVLITHPLLLTSNLLRVPWKKFTEQCLQVLRSWWERIE